MQRQKGDQTIVLGLRANNCFGVDVFKHYRNLCYRCVPVSFHDFASECLHYNINICRGKKVIYIKNWIESGIVSVGHLLGPNGYLSYEDFKAKYPDATMNFMLFEGIVRSVRHYQARLGLEFEKEKRKKEKKKTVILMKHVYGNACEEVVLSTFICIEKWSHNLNIHIDTRTVFRRIIKTT